MEKYFENRKPGMADFNERKHTGNVQVGGLHKIPQGGLRQHVD